MLTMDISTITKSLRVWHGVIILLKCYFPTHFQTCVHIHLEVDTSHFLAVVQLDAASP